MKMIIKVSDKHIKDGMKGKANYCPIALALREVVNTDNVSVDGSEIVIDKEFLPTPGVAESFIGQFDGNKPVKPFSFELNVPERYLF